MPARPPLFSFQGYQTVLVEGQLKIKHREVHYSKRYEDVNNRAFQDLNATVCSLVRLLLLCACSNSHVLDKTLLGVNVSSPKLLSGDWDMCTFGGLSYAILFSFSFDINLQERARSQQGDAKWGN